MKQKSVNNMKKKNYRVKILEIISYLAIGWNSVQELYVVCGPLLREARNQYS